ncbi:hypothetical protein [Streptomyces anthocyanicus]|uniref:hypothetical protein n=1 Tax=Streptomyces anthocyanicus TaxID=68174 RepID=UPI00384CAF1E
MPSLKDMIRNATDIQIQQDVEIPEWGVTVDVHGLPSGDWEQYQSKMNRVSLNAGGTSGKPDAEFVMRSNKAEIVAKALHEPETGVLVFPDVREGVAILSKRSGGIIAGLFELVLHLSGGEKDFVTKVKDAERDFSDGQS